MTYQLCEIFHSRNKFIEELLSSVPLQFREGCHDNRLKVVPDEVSLKLVLQRNCLGIIHPKSMVLHELHKVLCDHVTKPIFIHCGHPTVILMNCLEMHPTEKVVLVCII